MVTCWSVFNFSSSSSLRCHRRGERSLHSADEDEAPPPVILSHLLRSWKAAPIDFYTLSLCVCVDDMQSRGARCEWKRGAAAPVFAPHPQSVRSCLATGAEVKRSAKMVACERAQQQSRTLLQHQAQARPPIHIWIQII